ncbi:ATPase domain-containing protein [Halorientalis brevis]|uniref:non-specific serine/threonine protein kinase n=1 Tax=Halorientalis brevis TaxID=1126241 RepID=A0ABD6CF67_9EURY|nr:ATPase domain-containing protein [Halorientalis brevis]
MNKDLQQIGSGVAGLDDLLRGGFAAGRMYLTIGPPGSGKTLLGMHFLEQGLENSETTLLIHGEESQPEIATSAAAVDIDIDGTEFLDIGPKSSIFIEDRTYDLVAPSEIERDRYTPEIHEAVSEIDPDRVVIDPITQLRYVEANDAQFRRQLLSFMRFLKGEGITVLATATATPDREYESELRSLSDGIVELTQGEGGRRIEVTKHRTIGQIEGSHGMEIRDAGIEVFPALVPKQHEQSIGDSQISAGIDELDRLLGGGIERNTVTFITGPSGVGKTTLGGQILAEVAQSGTAALYLFEESIETFTHRSEAIGIPVAQLRQEGRLVIRSVEPLARSAEEFASLVRRDVEQEGVETVMVDGTDGYTMAIQGEREPLIAKLHSLSRYLTNNGVTMLVTDTTPEITGVSTATSFNANYIADNIVVLSYIEMDSALHKVIGVLKKRAGRFEQTLREFKLTDDGIQVGDPLTNVTGILQGTPSIAETPDGK